jgi:hypothetical protein
MDCKCEKYPPVGEKCEDCKAAPVSNSRLIDGLNAEAKKLLEDVARILEYQSKESVANQGQCLDGYSALANYNSVAEKIKTFLATGI